MERPSISRKLKRTVTAISKRLTVLRAAGVKVRK
jgi:biotin operon repressor